MENEPAEGNEIVKGQASAYLHHWSNQGKMSLSEKTVESTVVLFE
ncbi:hypothetical protein [Metabacillus litoralis]|nr:hypothetical protein [Metabacillus litoralis]